MMNLFLQESDSFELAQKLAEPHCGFLDLTPESGKAGQGVHQGVSVSL